MDNVTKQLQTFLVSLHYQPESVSGKMKHYMEHLFHLLQVDDEVMLCNYFGLFGHEQKALSTIARDANTTQEMCMAHIDELLHRLAITPEWELLCSIINQKKQ